ncbi:MULTISPECIES: hypothetical protein [Streptacidiphilus]|uniref:Uncharacterized protein n=1 Tax=Streptacidiphilus cavernicola TaxID=3342716 RepID=A0ABV6UTW0_9ACTN|nr:hypothetical protein [Streptacidiphilus jeojiense]
MDTALAATPPVPAPAGRRRRSRRVVADPDEPVYAALVAEWRGRGRTIPGETDWEWLDLAAYDGRR